MSPEATRRSKGARARRVALAAAGVTAVALAGLTSATSAAAAPVVTEVQNGYPTDCHDYLSKNGWFSRCGSGSGFYKSSVICNPWDGGPKFVRDAESWSTPGALSYSWVKCPAQTTAESGGILYSS
jgi:hypothetical protein